MLKNELIEQYEREWFANQDKGLYKSINWFNHNFVSTTSPTSAETKILDIGGGNGVHRFYELCAACNYYLLDVNDTALREAELALNKDVVDDYHMVNIIKHDVQERLPFEDKFFDKVVSVNSLEHIARLDDLFNEVKRVLKNDGRFCSVFPCEGGSLFKLGQRFTVAGKFKKMTGLDYFDYIKSEHVNDCRSIINKLKEHFKVKHIIYFPMMVPSVDVNVSVGVTVVKK